MSRLYYDAITNLKESKQGIMSPYIDYMAFNNDDKEYVISLSSNFESEYSIEPTIFLENSCTQLSGKWKGIDCKIEDYDGNIVHDYREISRDDIEIITDGVNTRLYEIGIYIPEENTEYEKGFLADIKKINIDIEIPGKKYGDIDKYTMEVCGGIDTTITNDDGYNWYKVFNPKTYKVGEIIDILSSLPKDFEFTLGGAYEYAIGVDYDSGIVSIDTADCINETIFNALKESNNNEQGKKENS